MYIDKLSDIMNKYDNTYHSKFKTKPVAVKSSTYIDSSKEINYKDRKFKIGDIVRISKHANIFAKGYTPNWPEEVFVIKEVNNTMPWTYLINDLNGEEIVGTSYEKELKKKKKIKKSLELKK